MTLIAPATNGSIQANVRFAPDKISDAKRYVRGEQLLYARTLLLSKNPSRLISPSVMILAGGAPEEEISSIRELWPRAHILAVDMDPACTSRAAEVGANETLCINLSKLWSKENSSYSPNSRQPPPEIDRKFELIDLDFCGPVNDDMGLIARQCVYTLLDRARGILLTTFSYGRDVAEFFLAVARSGHISNSPSRIAERLIERGLPETVVGRVLYLASRMSGLASALKSPSVDWERCSMTIRSVFLYPGNQMPMCSVLWEAAQVSYPRGLLAQNGDFSVAKATNDDLTEAVVAPDPAALYAVPQERLLALRRAAAARKAVITRTLGGATNRPKEAEESPA